MSALNPYPSPPLYRRTTQALAPAAHTPTPGAYNLYPGFPMGPGKIDLGFTALARRLADHPHVVLDGMVGVLWEDFRERLQQALAELGLHYHWLPIDAARIPDKDWQQKVDPFLGGSDPLFGTHCTLAIRDGFQSEKLSDLRRRAATQPRSIVYGCGAELASPEGAFQVYVDLPKNEIQFRARAGGVLNLGWRQSAEPSVLYKRFYFVDWPLLRAHQQNLLPRLDLIVDGQRADEPAVMSGAEMRSGLSAMANTQFRARPWFEPGPWGGQWIKRHFPGLPESAPNLAWSFELITPENGLAFESGGRLLEVAFDWLMFQENKSVLGDFAARFETSFPIRFDYLDTFDGGNLSLQCHPRPGYMRKHFGEPYTQDETYYIMDAAPDARVYLGFQEGVDPAAFEEALRGSHRTQQELDVERFVQTWPARKHDLFLIPSGTIHCSGRNNLVLEISATPYIFTFKMYDWLRLDLEGRPRPLNIDRAMDNLFFDRQGARISREFVAHPRILRASNGARCVHLATHPDHFYDVHRLEFTHGIDEQTEGSPHVLNVVEGPSATLVTAAGDRHRFAFGETFVVPAAAGQYRLESESGGPVKVVKAFLKKEDGRRRN